jgi:hypothetical protein
MMSTVFVIFLFSPGMPILYFLGFLFLLMTYYTNKLLLLKFYTKTENVMSREVPIQAVYYLRFALLIKLLAGIFMFNNPKLFHTSEPPSGNMPEGFLL